MRAIVSLLSSGWPTHIHPNVSPQIPHRTAKRVTSHKIVLISPFVEDVDDSNAQSVITQINEMKIDFIVISDQLEYQTEVENGHPDALIKVAFSQTQAKSQAQEKSEQLIETIVTQTNGVFSNFADAVLQLSYFPGTKSYSAPWHCPLTIGDELRLNVTAYIYVTRESLKSFKTESTDPKASSVFCTTQYQQNGKVIEDMDLSKTIEGYVYGDRKVPYDQCLNLDYDAGGKSFICIGFSPRRNVLDEYYAGKSTQLVVPQSTCGRSIHMLNSLGSVMEERDMVMIARRVRQKAAKPALMALFPMRHDEHQTIYFHMIELIFSENMLEFYFPDLTAKKYQANEEQIEAIDALIDSMDLMTADDGMEAFALDRTLNPAKQFMYRVISARAMDPNLPLPKFSEDLEKMFEMPESVKEYSKEAIDKLKELFPINEKDDTKKQRWMKKNILANGLNAVDATGADPSQSPTDNPRPTKTEIGTITPMEDFDLLYRSGEKFSVLCGQLQKVVSDLIFKSMSWEYETEKIAKALLYYREQAKGIGAHYYNDWVEGFKTQLLLRNNAEFFRAVLVKEKLGIINSDESETSVRTAAEVAEFYSSESVVKKVETGPAEDDEDDDMFDGM